MEPAARVPWGRGELLGCVRRGPVPSQPLSPRGRRQAFVLCHGWIGRGWGAERDVTNTPERARSPRPCLGEHPPLLAALQAEHPPCARPAPLPGRGRGRCGSSGCLIQLTNSRQDRRAIPRRLPLGGEGAPRGRGRGGDVTARQLTSGAPRQESLSKRARLGLCSECVRAYIRVRPCARVHTRVSMRRSPHHPAGGRPGPRSSLLGPRFGPTRPTPKGATSPSSPPLPTRFCSLNLSPPRPCSRVS